VYEGGKLERHKGCNLQEAYCSQARTISNISFLGCSQADTDMNRIFLFRNQRTKRLEGAQTGIIVTSRLMLCVVQNMDAGQV
jgi:hypothetical protein